MIALDLEYLLESEGASSFSFAVSEAEAISAARARRPDIITSDVTLIEGTGPAAVGMIRAALGDIPVVYITATPTSCRTNQTTRALGKPLDRFAIASTFQELRRLNGV